MDELSSLFALFTSSLLAATLLPGGSEAVLVGVLTVHPSSYWSALILATTGNTLGGMSSYLIGRYLPDKNAIIKKYRGGERSLTWIQKYGTPILLLSWAPLIGDVLCVTAGWLRLNWFWAMLCMLIGKFARYWIIAITIS